MEEQYLRAIIMDHYSYPRNKSLVSDSNYLEKHMSSQSCVDDITVQLKINDNIIKDVRFDGVGCTISISSVSIMSELLIGKSIEEVKQLLKEFMQMMSQEAYDEQLLEEAIALKGVAKFANRINCATLGWRAVEALLKELEDK